MDLNKTALRIPVPGTSALSPRLHPAAGTVPQRRLTEGSPLEVGLLFRTPRSSASSSLGVCRCVSNREREAERPGGKDAYKTRLDFDGASSPIVDNPSNQVQEPKIFLVKSPLVSKSECNVLSTPTF